VRDELFEFSALTPGHSIASTVPSFRLQVASLIGAFLLNKGL
jgi:hypothetical protein